VHRPLSRILHDWDDIRAELSDGDDEAVATERARTEAWISVSRYARALGARMRIIFDYGYDLRQIAQPTSRPNGSGGLIETYLAAATWPFAPAAGRRRPSGRIRILVGQARRNAYPNARG
jgi:hypothetical protein